MGTPGDDPLTGEPLFAQLWYGEALNFGKISDWNAQLDLARRLRVSSLSIHADAFLHARGAELLDQLVKQQREENLLGVWLHEYVQRVRAFQTASIARDLDGTWLLFGDALRTVRLPVSEKAPAISGDVIGYSDLHASPLYFPGAESRRSQIRRGYIRQRWREGWQSPGFTPGRSKRTVEILASQLGRLSDSAVRAARGFNG